MTVIEVIRLYLGYLGNLSEQVRDVKNASVAAQTSSFICKLSTIILKGIAPPPPRNIHFVAGDNIISTPLSTRFAEYSKVITVLVNFAEKVCKLK